MSSICNRFKLVEIFYICTIFKMLDIGSVCTKMKLSHFKSFFLISIHRVKNFFLRQNFFEVFLYDNSFFMMSLFWRWVFLQVPPLSTFREGYELYKAEIFDSLRYSMCLRTRKRILFRSHPQPAWNRMPISYSLYGWKIILGCLKNLVSLGDYIAHADIHIFT